MWWMGFALVLIAGASLGYFWTANANTKTEVMALNAPVQTEVSSQPLTTNSTTPSTSNSNKNVTTELQAVAKKSNIASTESSHQEITNTNSNHSHSHSVSPSPSNPIPLSPTLSNSIPPSPTFSNPILPSLSPSPSNPLQPSLTQSNLILPSPSVQEDQLNGKEASRLLPEYALNNCCDLTSPTTFYVANAKTTETSAWSWELVAGTNYFLASNEAYSKHRPLPGMQVQGGVTKRFSKFYVSSQIGWMKSSYLFDYVNTYNQSYTYNQIPLSVQIDPNGTVVNTIYGDSTVTATFTRKVRSLNVYQSAYINLVIGKEWSNDRWNLGLAVGPKIQYTYRQSGNYVGLNDMPTGKISEAGNGMKSVAVLPQVQLNVSRRLSSNWNLGIGVNASFGYAKLWSSYGKFSFVQTPVMLRLERQF
jgi:cytochrome oxidase Cu insertion factor (SCO1/SenC/PrrC family)